MDSTLITVACAAVLAVGLVALGVALRQRRKASAQLERLRREEQGLLERLAAGLAHELKNPLGALNLNLQLLQEELEESGVLPDGSRRRLALIMKECRRLEDVLANFLRYAMRRPLRLERVDLATLVDEVLTFLKPEIRGAGVNMETRFEANLPPLPVDVTLLKQALLNIIINAVEAMPGGGTLTVETRGSGWAAEIAVSDTGEGVPPEVMPRVFEVYFSDKKGGTGLGLAITRRIIEKHGGTVDLESAGENGTRVTVRLPFEQPPGSP